MNTSIYFDQLISGTFSDFIFLFGSVSFAASSVFKGRTGAFPAPVLIIGPSIWF